MLATARHDAALFPYYSGQTYYYYYYYMAENCITMYIIYSLHIVIGVDAAADTADASGTWCNNPVIS